MRIALVAVVLALALGATEAADRQPSQHDTSLRVVIDPGHGGGNSGAPGHIEGAYERELTLTLAGKLATQLEARGATVITTRDRDAFLTLRQRSDIANRAGADLFISVHANASPDHSRRGFETYVLSPKALDVDARALRTGETARRPGVDPMIDRLLDDVERGTAQTEAVRVARAIQAQLEQARPNSPNRGVKQASMHVLLGATMPAVLVEVGFLDHPTEGPELQDPEVQNRIAAAIASAVVSR